MRVTVKLKGQPDVVYKMRGKHTVGTVLARVRAHMEMKEGDAIFLYTPNGTTYPVSQALSAIPQPIIFNAIKESAFGALSAHSAQPQIHEAIGGYHVGVRVLPCGREHLPEV